MDRIRVEGGNRLKGSIPISGAKNAALPLMVASLLTDGPLVLDNVPDLADIRLLGHILAHLGVGVERAGRELTLTAGTVSDTTAPYDLVRKMRASFLVAGPLLARCGEATVSLPGGCAIGARPVDLHLKGFAALGADIELSEGYVKARAPGGLTGAQITFPFASVGATENVLMAACLARGTSVIENAALEPEVTDLAHCLIAMGAGIEGAGTGRLTITGKPSLGGARHAVVPDRIEAGTFAMAAAIAGGEVLLEGARSEHLSALTAVLRSCGIEVAERAGGMRVARSGAGYGAADIVTEPFPGFPTDLQAQFMALMCLAEGTSHIRETIFENRFMHAPELMRMGADITLRGQSAEVRGVRTLKGAPVMATDLRASVSLVLAGLAAEGESVISRVYHLDRGFERLEEKLSACGARIGRLKGEAQGG
ncbi:MAG: UDP-N-acetylglucosamine 1-carboxyvinyltransferase [Alphaproteobacteria bacterium]|nr:UDP-N-acetylglucosamine 1-carboxyvinyltransferase [Alphaproteobacteria bacterium]